MDHSSIKKALLMQLMAELSKEEMKPFRGKEEDPKHEAMASDPAEDAAEGETEDMACEPGSKADRMKKLKKLAKEA